MPRRILSLSRTSRLFSGLRTSSETDETKALSITDADSLDVEKISDLSEEVSAPVDSPNLKLKRVDDYWSTWHRRRMYRNTGSGVVAEGTRLKPGDNGSKDPWQRFCFVVVRRLPDPHEQDEGAGITFNIIVKSAYLLKACKDVIGQLPGISWRAEPLKLDPHILITFFHKFEAYEKALRNKSRTPEEKHVLASVNILLEYLRKDYRATLTQIADLTAHGEITFELLYAILVPRSILVNKCPVTGALRALKLVSVSKIRNSAYSLVCGSVDSTDSGMDARLGSSNDTGSSAYDWLVSSQKKAPSKPPAKGGRVRSSSSSSKASVASSSAFGRLETKISLSTFEGIIKITSLDAYPIDYHPDAGQLKATLIERGRKWASLTGIHHLHYKGAAAPPSRNKPKYSVNSRVMIDRGNYIRFSSDGDVPTAGAHDSNAGFADEELLLASPVLYGFSLSDKIWLRFNVEHLEPIIWNEAAFEGLVLDADKKNLLLSLVNAHAANVGFDDIVQGKGLGLIVNLFGPPGVGKTLSAEATSEHVHRPLYVVGGGDLGEYASLVDKALGRVFDIATCWKAIVLIDEADVFMERRSINDLDRNAMVAVFLRHVEYYRGILFLTTNRVKAIDEAFMSRIHVGLHFGELSVPAKVQVWRTFLRKAGVAEADIGDDRVQQLAARDINGRQIKNACRTAQSLAFSRGEPLSFRHLLETLDCMEEFAEQFMALTKGVTETKDKMSK